MSLRAALIEAGARIWHYDMEMWEEDDIAAAFLDVFLDVLADRADEARNQIYELWAAAPGESGDMLTDLIAVLRGDTGER